MTDSRIALLDSLVFGMPKNCFASDGKQNCYYCYVYFHRSIAINVGKGCGNRYLKFLLDQGYNSDEARAYIRKYSSELECFFATSNISETASFAIEHMLISHFKRRCEQGTLFNVSPGRVSALGTGPDLSHQRRTANVAPIPATLSPLSIGEHRRAHQDQPRFAPTDTLKLVTDESPWNHNTPGHRFFERVMLKHPSTVKDATMLAKQHNNDKPREERIGSAQLHLRWLYTWGSVPHGERALFR